MVNHFTALALTKLDVLDELKEVRIGYSYIDNQTGCELEQFPADLSVLNNVTVVYETMPGWSQSTRGCRNFTDLPPEAQAYVEAVERLCGVPIRWVGTGASRDSMIVRSSSHAHHVSTIDPTSQHVS
ncbi:unnamed protein product [Echinostoma caproni]|uniref:Adenylosuccinate synthetase n=1 Tax=Echinostoma caproni TaxID=27848 RepID=A0A183BAY5_9TREM|nr:unnamed protein product [Echinostoma caproni]